MVFAGLSGIPPTRQGSGSEKLKGVGSKELSQAVLDHVGSELVRIYQTMRTRGSVKADDVRAVAANMRLLFAHFEEVGFNAALEQYMKGHSQEVLDFIPQDAHLQEIHARLIALGIPVSRGWLRQRLSIAREKKVHLLARIERFGIQGLIKGGIGVLNRFATVLEQRDSGKIRVRYVFVSQDCPPEPGGTCICVCGVDCPPDYCT